MKPTGIILYRHLRSALTLGLALSLSGSLPVLSAAFAAEPTVSTYELFQSAKLKADELHDRLTLLVRRARHPNSPGASGGLPGASDLDHIQEDFRSWHLQMEQVLLSPELSRGTLTTAVNTYLREFTLLLTLRIALNLPHGSVWIDSFALHIPRAIMNSIPNQYARPELNRLGDPYAPLVIDSGADGKADPVSLKISAGLLQGLELGHLADHPGSDTHVTMIQYMAVRQLLNNLVQISQLKVDHHLEFPAIPAPLRSKIGSLGLLQTIHDEENRAMVEPVTRLSLLREASVNPDLFPPFVDEKYTAELATWVGTTAETRNSTLAPLRTILAKGEKEATDRLLKKILSENGSLLSGLNATELLPQLRQIVGDAKGLTQIEEFAKLRINHSLGALNVEQREQIRDAIYRHSKAYQDALPENLLLNWFAEARATATNEAAGTTLRSEFIDALMIQAPQVSQDVQQTYAGDIVIPSVLGLTFATELTKLGARDSTLEWLMEIRDSRNYAEARDTYAQIMAKATSPEVVVLGNVDPNAVQSFLDHHEFAPDLKFAPDVSAAYIQKVKHRVIEGHKKDIRDLLEIGKWFRFNMEFASQAPNVQDILPDETKSKRYFKLLDQSTRSELSMLAYEVTFKDNDGSESRIPLAEALTRINPSYISRQDILERAQPMIDEVLGVWESNIRREIELVAKSQDLAEIEAAVGRSMMRGLVMKGFPEFQMEHDAFIRKLLEPSFSEQVLHRYLGTAGYGFVAIGLIQAGAWATKYVAKDAAPYLTLVSAGVESVLGGVMQAAMIGMAADAAYSVAEEYHEFKIHQQAEALSQTRAWGASLIDASELDTINHGFWMATSGFAARTLVDTIFMYYPMTQGLVTAAGDKITLNMFTEDTQALEKLGLAPGEFDRVADRMMLAREVRNPNPGRRVMPNRAGDQAADELKFAFKVHGMNTAEFAELELASAQLAAKIRAGKSYRFPNILEEIAKEDCFKELQLNAKFDSFAKIDEAYTRLNHAKLPPGQQARVDRAHLFLKGYLEGHPEAATQAFTLVEAQERKLVEALGRKRFADVLWKSISPADLAKNPSAVGAP